MPSRNNTRRVATPDLQGDDSWVEVRSLSVNDYNEIMTLTRSSQGGADEATLMANEAAMYAVYARNIVRWNWVDDDGAALPQPSEDVTVLGQLTMQELEALTGLLRPGSEQKKDVTQP